MTVQKTAAPLVLLMFTVLCALPAAAAVGVIPSAFAQVDDDDDQDLSPDDTNMERAGPIIDQDQGAANLGANLAANLAANLDVEHIIEETRPTPPEEEEPPEFVAFCHEFPSGEVHCYETLQDCIAGEEQFGVQDPDCEGVETLPPNAGECTVDREQGSVLCRF